MHDQLITSGAELTKDLAFVPPTQTPKIISLTLGTLPFYKTENEHHWPLKSEHEEIHGLLPCSKKSMRLLPPERPQTVLLPGS